MLSSQIRVALLTAAGTMASVKNDGDERGRCVGRDENEDQHKSTIRPHKMMTRRRTSCAVLCSTLSTPSYSGLRSLVGGSPG